MEDGFRSIRKHVREALQIFLGGSGVEADDCPNSFSVFAACKRKDERLLYGELSILANLLHVQVGGKPVGRRLRHPHEYCLEINASLRGLPWPPVKDEEHPVAARNDDANEVLAEERIDDDVDPVSAEWHEVNDDDSNMDCDEVVMNSPPLPEDIGSEKPMLSDENANENASQVDAQDDETEECEPMTGEKEADAMKDTAEDERMDPKDGNLSDADSGIDLSMVDDAVADSE